jgi:competence transcription factor ComK
MIIAEDYSINQYTMMLEITYSDLGEQHTIVSELYQDFYVKKPLMTILKENLLLLGKTYDGTIKATRYFLPGQKMLCIPFSALDRICFICSTSIARSDNKLISYAHILKIEASEKGSIVRFVNGKQLYLPINHRILQNRRRNGGYVVDMIANHYRSIQKGEVSPPFFEENDRNDFGDFLH